MNTIQQNTGDYNPVLASVPPLDVPPLPEAALRHEIGNTPELLPIQLRIPHWIGVQVKRSEDGKLEKIPCDLEGNKIDVNDKTKHMSFWEGITALHSGKVEYLGFVLSPETGLTVIDIDGCRDPETGEVNQVAKKIVDRIKSYTEVSASGRGIHIFMEASKPGDRCKHTGLNIEIYDQKRAIVVTGDRQKGTEHWGLNENQTELNDLYAELFPEPQPSKSTASKSDSSQGYEAEEDDPGKLPDEEILNKAKASKNGGRFEALYSGDYENAGYSSHSEADAALLSVLRFWTGSDKDQSFRLFENSGLFRDKWQREDYRDRTWDLVNHGDVYSPRGTYAAPREEIPKVPIFDGEKNPVPKTARRLAQALGECGQVYQLHQRPVLIDDENVITVKNVTLSAIAQPECVSITKEKTVQGRTFTIPITLSKEKSDILLASPEFLRNLPKIQRFLPCPGYVATENGELLWIEGYDPESGVFAKGEAIPTPVTMPLEEAISNIMNLIQDFCVIWPSERSRMVAMLLSPAFMLSGAIHGCRAPIFLLEALVSQTGKGYLARMLLAMYNMQVGAVSQRKRGVGSLEESMHTRILNGDNILYLDNLKGSLNSPEIESFATEDYVACRIPYRGAVSADVRNVMMLITSNSMDITRDLENRLVRIRLRKQPASHQFTQYPEGDLLAHVRKNQHTYYRSACRVLLEWQQNGRQRTNENRHARREWAQVMDWVVQNIMHLPPLLNDTNESKERATNPRMEWLREICIAVDQGKRLDESLNTTDLLHIMEDHSVSLFQDKGGPIHEEQRRVQDLGTQLAPLFRQVKIDPTLFNQPPKPIHIEEYTVWRVVQILGMGRDRKSYHFQKNEPNSEVKKGL